MASIAQLGSMMTPANGDAPRPTDTPQMPSGPIGGKGLGGGGGSAQDGLGQINSGAATVGSAIGTAQSALGGGGGNPNPTMYKKGGEVKKSYTTGGKINLNACGVSTTSKGKKNSDW